MSVQNIPTVPEEKESKVEITKRASGGLRGDLAATLDDEKVGYFSDDGKILLKFHGIYEQYDRDAREKVENRNYNFMVRLAIPGGVLSAKQYLAIDDLAGAYGGGQLRITTRQGLQLHGVLKNDLRPSLQGIHQNLLTTLAACGDVRRNVVACPAPLDDDAHRTVQATANAIARELQPRTGAYHEIWLDGAQVDFAAESEHGTPAPAGTEEPFYGATYLPRKFKIAVALDTDNCVDVFTQDAGLLGITENGKVIGWNVLAGGGLGITHGKTDTFARLATEVAFVPVEQGVAVIRAVGALYRDHGNRADRKRARLKYVIEAWGLEKFRQVLQTYVDFPLPPARKSARPREEDHLGAHPHGGENDRFFYGVFVENGRILDRPGFTLRSALREIVRRFRPGVHLTAMQSVLFTHLPALAIPEIEAILGRHGVKKVEELSQLRRYSLACPALPTCSLALTEAERALPAAIDDLEAEFTRLGIDEVPLTVRMTGCPNGCARPYNADLAFVGRKPGVYHIYVGGGLGGDRLADLYAADVPTADFVPSLRPLLERYRDEKRPQESLGDYWQRLARPAYAETSRPRHLLTGKETAEALRLLEPATVEASS